MFLFNLSLSLPYNYHIRATAHHHFPLMTIPSPVRNHTFFFFFVCIPVLFDTHRALKAPPKLMVELGNGVLDIRLPCFFYLLGGLFLDVASVG